jgi:hypothetical protein
MKLQHQVLATRHHKLIRAGVTRYWMLRNSVLLDQRFIIDHYIYFDARCA